MALLLRMVIYLLTINKWLFGGIQYEEENGKTYDYIVVGGGTAGCIIASRLSENSNKTVLLIEAGSEPPFVSSITPLFITSLVSKLDWNFKSVPQTELKLARFGSFFHSGKMLGGSSCLNGAIYIRAFEKDFESWVNSGAKNWDWESVSPYYARVESVMKPTKCCDCFRRKHNDTSVNGCAEHSEVFNSFVSGIKEKCGTDSKVSYVPLTIDANGRRMSPFTNYLKPLMGNRNNLFVETNAVVEKILFDSNNRAIGVKYSKEGKHIEVNAKHEVILAAGAINSPKLLMLSGIGPKDHLLQFNITVRSDLPVGLNLRDHFGVKQVESEHLNNIFNPLAYNGISAFLNSKLLTNETDFPDLQVVIFRYSLKYVVVTFLLRPESAGFVRLKSTDPNDAPTIDANYLSSENDVKVISDGIKKVSQIVKSMGLTEQQIMNCNQFEHESDEHWKCKAKMLGNGFFHAVGTCKMGSINSPESVVDEKLNVIGVKGLRVADASIFPTQIAANPQATVMMVAERVVDFIKQLEQ